MGVGLSIKITKNALREINREIDRTGRVARRAETLANKRTIQKIHTQSVRAISNQTSTQQKLVRNIVKRYFSRAIPRIGKKAVSSIWVGSKGIAVKKRSAPSQELKYGPKLEEPSHATPFYAQMPSGAKGLFFRKGKSRLKIDFAHYSIFEESKRIIQALIRSQATRIYIPEFHRQYKRLIKRRSRR